MNSLMQSSRKFLFMGLVILFFAGCINNTKPPEMQTIDIKSLDIVRVRPGSPPELLEILISGNKIYPFKNVSNKNFRISPAQTIRANKIIYLVEPLNDSFTGDDRYKDFSGFMFCLKVDIKKLINGF